MPSFPPIPVHVLHQARQIGNALKVAPVDIHHPPHSMKIRFPRKKNCGRIRQIKMPWQY